MNPIVLAGFLAFLVASLLVGLRLLALWFRSRELPELLIGFGVLGIGPVGFGGMIGASALHASQPALARTLFAVAFLAIATGVTCKAVFNARVYHPQSRATGLVWLAVALFFAAVFGWRLAGGGFGPTQRLDGLAVVQSWVQIGVLLWGAAEALRYWRLMRRRLTLGLADPVVTNRFLMWGIGAGSAGVGSAVGTVAQMATGVSSLEIPWAVASSSAHGFVAAVALSLAFLPPAAYVRRLRTWAPVGEGA